MKTLILTFAVSFLGSAATFAQREPQPQSTLAAGSGLTLAKLQPASGIDLASGLGGRGTVRTAADSADAWKLRFPKQPNGRLR